MGCYILLNNFTLKLATMCVCVCVYLTIFYLCTYYKYSMNDAIGVVESGGSSRLRTAMVMVAVETKTWESQFLRCNSL